MAISDVGLTSSMRSNLLLLQRTQDKVNSVQNKLATGNKINTALDGPNEFFAAKGLNTRANDLSKLKDSMGQAISTIKSADSGITSIESFIDQMRGITTSALGSLGDDAASIATRKTLSEQFNALKEQIDQLAGDSGYGGKNLLAGNGKRLDSTSTTRLAVNSLTGVSNARVTNISSADTYSIRFSGDGAMDGNASDIANAETAHGLVGLKVSGTLSTTLGSLQDISIKVSGVAGQSRTFTVTDGNESRVTKFFDDSQSAEATLQTAAASGVAQASTVSFDGTIEEGDIFKVTIEGVTLSYTASSTDTKATIGSSLAASINSAITSGRLTAADFTSGTAAVAGSGGTITVTGSANANSANDFTIAASTTNALTKRISQSFASGAVVSFTIDREGLEAASSGGNGTSTIQKNVNIQVSVTNLAGDIVTRDGNNARGQGKLSDGENAFQFGSGTVRLNLDEGTVQKSASANAAKNIVTRQVTDANTQNDITVSFNEDNTNTVTVESQNVTTSGLGLGIDYAQNNFLDREDIDNAVSQLDGATQKMRDASQTLSTNLNIITTRENFTKEFSDVLTEGANKLTLADQNEEGANLLMLQTRQQLGTISLSLANQQQQSILRLF